MSSKVIPICANVSQKTGMDKSDALQGAGLARQTSDRRVAIPLKLQWADNLPILLSLMISLGIACGTPGEGGWLPIPPLPSTPFKVVMANHFEGLLGLNRVQLLR